MIMLSGSLSANGGLFSGGIREMGAELGVMFALIAALCAAVSNVQIRFLNGIENPGAIVFYFSLMTTLIGFATSVFGWVKPSYLQLALVVGCGFFGGMAQILVTLSLRYTDASLLAPFDYTMLVWSMLIGYLFLNSLPDFSTLFGAGIVAFAGLFTLWREQRHRRPMIRTVS